MPDSGLSSSATDVRNALARHIRGLGVELGPGHQPFEVPYPAVSVTYLDRWSPDENRDLFPELADAHFREPDVVCDLSTERLAPLGDQSQDFVIASHVLEHLPEPLGILAEIHRVLRPGGVAIVLLPDRRRTFDKDRVPTPLAHLIEEYESGVTVVDDAHVIEFLAEAPGASYTEIPAGTPAETAAFLDWHRKRSIHVHCWHESEFVEVLLHGVARMGQDWELLDATVADDQGETGLEFGFVLRRDDAPMAGDLRAERLDAVWQSWYAGRREWHAARTAQAKAAAEAAARAEVSVGEVGRLTEALQAAYSRLNEMQTVIDHQDRRLALFRRSPLYPVFRALPRVLARSRRMVELRARRGSHRARGPEQREVGVVEGIPVSEVTGVGPK